MFDVEFGIEVLQCLIKLSAINGDDGVGKFKLAYDRFLKEILDLVLCDVHQRFCLPPFGKIVNDNDLYF